jgi:N-acetylglucosamine-6-phosphate deacetylase
MQRMTGRDPRTGLAIEVVVRNGLVASIVPGPEDETAWLSAGLVDLQVNGYCGFDLNAEDITPQAVFELAKSLAKGGVTTFLPTLITQSEDRLITAMQTIAAARAQDPFVSHMIAGIHVEGPSISPEDGPRGAHPREHVRPPSLEEFARWQAASGNLIRLLTLSPHFKESAQYIAGVASQGVAVSVGHTGCSSNELDAAVAAGATLSTHLGNGIADPLPRHPNLIWSQLADDRLTAMFIADGHHLPADTLKVMLRAKGPDRTILVSDLVALGGLPPGRYTAPVGGDVELSSTGRLSLAGTPFLAGAVLPLKDGVAHIARSCTIPFSDAMRFATVNPGRLVGARGNLQVGAAADLIRFSLDPNHHLEMETVLVAGELLQ